MEEQDIFYLKYVKYKTKYDNLKKLLGGNNTPYRKNNYPNYNPNTQKRYNPTPKPSNQPVVYSGEKDKDTLTDCVLQRCKDEGKKIYSDHSMIHYKIDDIDVRTWNISDQISADMYGSVENPSYGHKFILENGKPFKESEDYGSRLKDIADKIKPYILEGSIILLQEAPSWFPYNDNFVKQIKELGKNIIVVNTDSNYIALNADIYKDIQQIDLGLLNLQRYDRRILKRPPVIIKLNKGNRVYTFVSTHIGYIAEDENKDKNITSLKNSFDEIVNSIRSLLNLNRGNNTVVFGGDFNRPPDFLQKMLEIPNSKFYTSTSQETSYKDNKGGFNQGNVDLLFVVR